MTPLSSAAQILLERLRQMTSRPHASCSLPLRRGEGPAARELVRRGLALWTRDRRLVPTVEKA